MGVRIERLRAEAAVIEKHSERQERREVTPEQTSVAEVMHIVMFLYTR